MRSTTVNICSSNLSSDTLFKQNSVIKITIFMTIALVINLCILLILMRKAIIIITRALIKMPTLLIFYFLHLIF